MSTKRDKIQLEIEINGQKATEEHNKLLKKQAELKEAIKELPKETEEYIKKTEELRKVTEKLDAGTYRGMVKEARNLKNQLYSLTPGTKKYIETSKKLKTVQDKLATIRKETRGVAKGMAEMKAKATGLPGLFAKIGPALGALGIAAGIGAVISGVKALFTESFKLFDIQAKADAQLKATLNSTNEAAGRSFEQLKAQAASFQKQSLFGDEQIQGAQAVLLTFTKVRGEIFDRTLPAVLDLSTALKTDTKSAAIQLGKALNDPITGVSALAEAGVQFSVDQKAMIKSLVDTGDTAGAQKIILAELETQFKGSAKAAAESGLGPYTQLNNRLSDVKESIGLLLEKGLKVLTPVLTGVVSFVEKFTNSVVSGDKATGKMSTGVNTLIFVFKAVGFVFSLIYTRLSNIYNIITTVINVMAGFIQKAKDFKYIGTYIKFVIGYFKLLGDIVNNSSAAFAGFKAAANQSVENIKGYFEGLIISAEIMAKKLDLFLSIKSSTKARLRQEILDLQQLQTDAAQSAKTIGEAYNEAYAKTVAESAKAKTTPDTHTATSPSGDTVGGDNNPSSDAAAASIEKIKAKVKEEGDTRLLELEANYAKEKLILEAQRLDRDITERNYQASLLQSEVEYINSKIDILGETEVVKKLELQNRLREIDNENYQLNLDEDLLYIEESALAQEELLAEKFELALITEQEFELAKLLQKDLAYQEQLDLLISYGLQESDQHKAIQELKLRNQKEINAQAVDNQKRTEDLKGKIGDEGRALALNIFDTAIDLLGKDEAARKKHAGAIKAFQAATTLVNLEAELSGIFAGYAKMGPIGQIIAAVKAGLSIARATASISKIKSQQFYSGGHTGSQSIYTDADGHGVAGVVHINEWVAPAWMQGDERAQPHISYLENLRINRGGYVDGGLVADTTPNISTDELLTTESNESSKIIEELQMLRSVMASYPTTLKANVIHGEYESVSDDIAFIQSKANIKKS